MRLVAFPFHDWRKAELEGFRTRDLHVLEWLARDVRVDDLLVIDRPISRAERIARGGRPATGVELSRKTAGGFVGRLVSVRDRVRVLDISTPAVLGPIRRRRGWWFDIFGDQRTVDLVDWAIAEFGSGPVSAIAWTPTVAPILSKDRFHRVVFDSLDNWLIHPTLRANSLEAGASYRSIMQVADTVVVAAPASRSIFQRWRPDVLVIPNGVDVDAFSGDRARPQDLPAAPIVGYAGKLGHRIDSELVRDTALALPHVSFVFVGPILERRAIRPLRHVPNVVLLGDRPYVDLPNYVRNFDVAWIPHRVGEGETGGDPIKLYEYWAAGRQVISTRIDGIDRWAARLCLVNTADEAVGAIQVMLSGVHTVDVTVPEDRTWQAIARRLLGLLVGGVESMASSAPQRGPTPASHPPRDAD